MKAWSWTDAAPSPPLAPDAAPRVWAVDLDACPADVLAGAAAVLSSAERRRAEAFHAPTDRRRFVASRLALRRILGAHIGARPEVLAFRTLAHGKPVLADGGPSFSLAHTGGHLAVAVHATEAVGVDVEAADPGFDVGAVAARVLTDREWADLAASTPAARAARFVRCWTLKEAILKATGEGLSRPMRGLDVDPDGLALRAVPAGYPAPDRWRLRAWADGDGLVGALAWVPGGF